jgi:hypothetical protein
MMAKKELGTYLNNHLSASVTALELLSSLESQKDTEMARFASDLRAEIEAEQKVLGELIDTLEIGQNLPGQAVGWLAEKVTQFKLRMDDSKDGALHLLESLELMLIAIEGKRGLWRALAFAAVPGLPLSDYERYAAQSESQQRRVEEMRLEAAKAAFA